MASILATLQGGGSTPPIMPPSSGVSTPPGSTPPYMPPSPGGLMSGGLMSPMGMAGLGILSGNKRGREYPDPWGGMMRGLMAGSQMQSAQSEKEQEMFYRQQAAKLAQSAEARAEASATRESGAYEAALAQKAKAHDIVEDGISTGQIPREHWAMARLDAAGYVDTMLKQQLKNDQSSSEKEWGNAVNRGEFNGSFTDWKLKFINAGKTDVQISNTDPYKIPAGLRGEVGAHPDVKSMGIIAPVYRSMIDAPDTPQGDAILVNGAAKILDPASIVRESEADAIIKANTPEDQVAGLLAYLKDKKGRLTPTARKKLIDAIGSRAREHEVSYKRVMDQYAGLAKSYNIDPAMVVGGYDYSIPAPQAGLGEEGALPLTPADQLRMKELLELKAQADAAAGRAP